MTRRLKVPFSLSRKRIRASFNKYNVYNALTWRKNRPLTSQYRQVFFAKQEARSYHGDRLTENQFKNHFRGDLPVVSPLKGSKTGSREEDIPYALQSFVGLERRLDFALFRSLFASSVRQAAYFILRGSVKVNGVRIKSPGYILRPGDMFSIDPRRVLYALGRAKPSKAESVKYTNRIIKKFNEYIDSCHADPQRMWARKQKNRKRHIVYNAKYTARRQRRVETHNKELQKQMKDALEAVRPVSLLESVFKNEFKPKQPKVQGTVREIQRLTGMLSQDSKDLKAETAEEVKAGAEVNAKDATVEPTKADSTDAKVEPTKAGNADSKVDAKEGSKVDSPMASVITSAPSVPASAYYDSSAEAPPHRRDVKKLVQHLLDSEKDAITASFQSRFAKIDEDVYDPDWVKRLPAKLPLLKEEEVEDVSQVKVPLPFSTTGGKLYGLAEPSKTWFTPWSPRPFIAPFSILPHHIEVDFETCHAVYLRDPVARPGHSEVVSPFNLDMHERAYLWYIFRRRKNLPSLN